MKTLRKSLYILAAGAVSLAAASCEESLTAGGSLVEGEVEIVRDSLFTISGVPDANPSVRARSVLQLLGRLDAEGYGSISSDVVCQYMSSSTLDTEGVTADNVDSVKLILSVFHGAFTGDSVAPMGINVHRLIKPLPTTTLNSDFDPSGYYDPEVIGSTSYSMLFDGDKNIGTDSEGSLYKNISITLPLSLARELYDRYQSSPQTFSTPQAFTQWFPGLYLENSFGSGRITRISSNTICFYYHYSVNVGTEEEPRDSILYSTAAYMGVTPEVYTNNNIRYSMAPALKAMADAGDPIIVAPVGYDVEFKFPARDILRKYKEQAGELAVVNSLMFRLPAETITNEYGITPPPYVLMVKKSEKDNFFDKMKLTDNISSFYASYDSSSKSYTFSSMTSYINEIIAKGSVDAEDEEFVICPVNVSFYVDSNSSNYYSYYYYGYSTGGTSTVSSITPYVSQPVMCKLNFDEAEVKFSFSKHSL